MSTGSFRWGTLSVKLAVGMRRGNGNKVLWVILILAGLWVGTHWDEFVSFLSRGWGMMPAIKERLYHGEGYSRG